MDNIRLAAPITFDSVVDGPGLRTVIWMQGCHHCCPGCHNPQTHDSSGGYEESIQKILDAYRSDPLQQGITISGGEPFMQPKALLALLQTFRPLTSSIWLYTGYTFEELTDPSHPNYELHLTILSYLNVLVDGRFIQSQKDISLRYRGSANQRIIDIAKTCWTNQITLWEPDF